MNNGEIETELINKVALSDLMTIDLEQFYPNNTIFDFDLKEFLFHGLILKEKDFRIGLKSYDWKSLEGNIVAVHCSADAIIPMWAYMLVSTYCFEHGLIIRYGSKPMVTGQLIVENFQLHTTKNYIDKKVIIKGCSDKEIPAEVFLSVSSILLPLVKSLMFGEPCSTVPIYKKK